MRAFNSDLLICPRTRRAVSARYIRRVLGELWWQCASCQGWHPLACCEEERPPGMPDEEIVIVGGRIMTPPAGRGRC